MNKKETITELCYSIEKAVRGCRSALDTETTPDYVFDALDDIEAHADKIRDRADDIRRELWCGWFGGEE